MCWTCDFQVTDVVILVCRCGFGILEWQAAVDLNNQNLDRDVSISRNNVAVYDKDANGTPEDEQPERGDGLNVPCMITLEQVLPPDEETTGIKNRFSRKVITHTENGCNQFDP